MSENREVKSDVFYNGTEDRPSIETLRLSDSFEENEKEPMLELICKVYNINPGKNDELLSKCKVLFQYMKFIEKIRELEELGAETPIQEAIDWCIRQDILAEFLQDRGQEVTKAMTIDMTWERREQLIRRDERAEGRFEGIELERVNIITNALNNGYTLEEIASFTGLDLDEVLAIQKKLK